MTIAEQLIEEGQIASLRRLLVFKFKFKLQTLDPAYEDRLQAATPAALDAAIDACVRGELADLKTELGLRRLRDHLGI